MPKSRRTTWRSGSGWWNDSATSLGGDLGSEIFSETEDTRTQPASGSRKRKPTVSPKPENKPPEERKKGSRKNGRRVKQRWRNLDHAEDLPAQKIYLGRLLLEAKSSVIGNPGKAREACLNALRLPSAPLRSKYKSGRTYRQVFSELLAEAERSLERRGRLQPSVPSPRGRKR